ncbi:transcriptional regulator Kaiso-like isoform X2 [Periplaneta americana]
MGDSQEFCLRWSSYQDQLTEALRSLLDRELLVDVTLACDGRSLRAHRAILSACSSYFQELFQQSSHPHPIVILKDVRFDELKALVKFMYHGEVTMNNDSLPGFLKTAETLHIRGLTNRVVPIQEMISTQRAKEMEERLPQDVTAGEDSNSTDNNASTESTNDTVTEKPSEPKRIKTEPQVLLLNSMQPRDDSNIPVESPNVTTMEQEERCTLKSDDLQILSTESFASSDRDMTQKPYTTLDGLSQLVLPVLHEDSRSSSQYTFNQGLCHSILPHQQPSPNNHGIGSRPFRHRVLWNHDQLLQLESWYRADRYPTGLAMRHYADALAAMCPTGASPTRQNVDYWFQNRRRKDSHPEVLQQREKKKLAKTLWGNILDQRAGHSGSLMNEGQGGSMMNEGQSGSLMNE